LVRGFPPRHPLRRCYRSLSAAPLHGSLGQQPCGAAVTAAMVAPCVDGVLRAAIVDREPLPSVHGVGVVVGSCRQTAATSPRPPLLLRVSNRFALPPLIRPTISSRSIAGKTSLPHRCEKRETFARGRFWQGGFGHRRILVSVQRVKNSNRVQEVFGHNGKILDIKRRSLTFGLPSRD